MGPSSLSTREEKPTPVMLHCSKSVCLLVKYRMYVTFLISDRKVKENGSINPTSHTTLISHSPGATTMTTGLHGGEGEDYTTRGAGGGRGMLAMMQHVAAQSQAGAPLCRPRHSYSRRCPPPPLYSNLHSHPLFTSA